MSALKVVRSGTGFTLLETLIVLSIVSMVLLFGVITLHPVMGWVQKKMFISQLENDLYHAHAHAMNREDRVIIAFSLSEQQYTAKGESGGLLFARKLHPSVRLTGGTLYRLQLSITPDGTVNHFGNVQFTVHDQPLELAFHIGRGRFIVKE
ncbi:competence type IV pilus minor pilin ComGD [Siminovitchia sediminis]|uniref:Competence type IV pilus minor pilin ComGD n=1 Tax=Siminovitchia sediminis TaxID=1274353 RepID=A0ABW4KB20_9BACI